MSKPLRQEATAFHEAGHAVAAVHQGISIGRKGVTIIPNGDASGRAHTLKAFAGRPDIELTGTMRLGAERKAIVILAGEAAQRRHRPTSIRAHHGHADRRAAIELMSYFVGSDRQLEAYLRLLQIRTEDMLAIPPVWAAVERVAHALMQRGSLTSKEVQKLYTQGLHTPDEPTANSRTVGLG